MENRIPEFVQILEKMFVPSSERFLKLMGMIISQEEARLLLAMPGQPADLARKRALPLDGTEEMIRVLYLKGLGFPQPQNRPTHLAYGP